MQESFLYILVDEFQDTSGAQMRLINNLFDLEREAGRPNLLVVGDDDQSIYKFSGASLDNIIDFTLNYKKPEIITLTKNYRSTQDILDLADGLISNADKRLSDTLSIPKKILSQVGTE